MKQGGHVQSQGSYIESQLRHSTLPHGLKCNHDRVANMYDFAGNYKILDYYFGTTAFLSNTTPITVILNLYC